MHISTCWQPSLIDTHSPFLKIFIWKYHSSLKFDFKDIVASFLDSITEIFTDICSDCNILNMYTRYMPWFSKNKISCYCICWICSLLSRHIFQLNLCFRYYLSTHESFEVSGRATLHMQKITWHSTGENQTYLCIKYPNLQLTSK